jgi:hypothetical protein
MGILWKGGAMMAKSFVYLYFVRRGGVDGALRLRLRLRLLTRR